MSSINYNELFWCRTHHQLEQCSCTSNPHWPCNNCGCHESKAKVRNIYGYMHEKDDPSTRKWDKDKRQWV
jgi:hypothetical protein